MGTLKGLQNRLVQNQVIDFKKYLIILLTCVLASCDSEHKGSRPGNGGFGGEVVGTTKLTYEYVKTNILQKKCIECHDPADKHKPYEDPAIVRLARTEILARINSTNPRLKMPKGIDLTAKEKAELEEWLLAGAPEFGSNDSGGTDPEPGGDKVRYSFADITENVLKPNQCLACHSQYSDYNVVRKDIVAIVGSISKDRMPYPLKKDGDALPPVTKAQKQMIINWATQGAPRFVGIEEPIVIETLQANFNSLRNNLLGPRCIMCHNKFGKRMSGIPMATYEDILLLKEKKPKYFDNAETSHFIAAIEADFGLDFYDEMPLVSARDDVSDDYPKVTEEEKDIIRQWIRLGLPETAAEQAIAEAVAEAEAEAAAAAEPEATAAPDTE